MKKEKIPHIISLAILTLITSVLWIFFSLYRVFTSKPNYKVSEEILTPFSATLDEKIILEIENRVFIEQNQIPDNIVKKETIISETENPSPSPESEQATEQINTETPVETGTEELEEI